MQKCVALKIALGSGCRQSRGHWGGGEGQLSKQSAEPLTSPASLVSRTLRRIKHCKTETRGPVGIHTRVGMLSRVILYQSARFAMLFDILRTPLSPVDPTVREHPQVARQETTFQCPGGGGVNLGSGIVLHLGMHGPAIHVPLQQFPPLRILHLPPANITTLLQLHCPCHPLNQAPSG